MRWNSGLGWLCCTCGCLSAFAAEPAQSPPVDAAAVKALLQRVDSDQAAERTAAVRELLSLGSEILPLLPPPERMESAAGRDLVVDLRNVLERRQAAESARAATVSLNTTAPARELIAAITQQTGNRVAFAPESADPSLTVDWTARPFWETVDDIAVKTKSQVVWNPQAGQFVLGPLAENGPRGMVAHAGPFRVTAQVGKLKATATDASPSILRVQTLWQAEPRLRPLFFRIKPSDWQGTVDEKAVSPWNPEAEYELPFADGTRELTWPLDLIWPEVADSSTWTLRGKAMVHLAAMTETIAFDAIALRPNVQRRRGGVAVRIRKAEFRPGEDGRLQATIRIQVSYDTGGPAFESHRAGVFYQGGSLQGPAGQRISFTDMEATQEADGAIGVEYRFRDLHGRGSDFQFRYEAPTLFLDVPVEVDFRGLPGPDSTTTG